MKKIMKPIVTVILMLSFIMGFSLLSYASEVVGTNIAGRVVDESILLAPSVTSSRSTQPDERSSVLAHALSEVSNRGNGVVGGYAETLCYKETVWMCLTLYLERYNEATNDWVYVQDYYQEFEPDANGILHMVTYSFTEEVEPGYYYRVRCRHELEFEDEEGDIWYEAKVTRTNGIMITSTP